MEQISPDRFLGPNPKPPPYYFFSFPLLSRRVLGGARRPQRACDRPCFAADSGLHSLKWPSGKSAGIKKGFHDITFNTKPQQTRKKATRQQRKAWLSFL